MVAYGLTIPYSRNLDPNSAHYDPKTRSMRKNPYEGTGKDAEEVSHLLPQLTPSR